MYELPCTYSCNLVYKTDQKCGIDMNADDFRVIAAVMPRCILCIVSFG